jgi:thiol-disulfide isomerase/thioredoxin
MDMHDEQPSTPSSNPIPTPASPGGAEGPQRPSRTAAWLSMAAVAVALGLLWMASRPPVDEGAEPPSSIEEAEAAAFIGKPARLDFTLKDMHGADVRLSSFKGKVILINFWATWCGPCKAEIPSLVELQEEYRGDVVILGLSTTDTAEQIRPYADEYAMNYPVLITKDREEVQDAYGPMWGIPMTIIVDRDGKIAKRHAGIGTKEQFEREIKALL